MSTLVRHPLSRAPLTAALAALTATLGLPACWDARADLFNPLTTPQEGAGPGGNGSGGGSGAGGTSGGGTSTGGSLFTGPVTPDCVPNQTGAPVQSDCGIFVSAANGDDTAAGSREHPVATLAQAIYLAEGRPIYACADSAVPFNEPVVVPAAARIFGALDCDTWDYQPQKRTRWTAPPNTFPLRVADAALVEMEDVTLESADATLGRSSIALLAQAASTVRLSRCEVIAGQGAHALLASPVFGNATEGVEGHPGDDGCLDATATLGGLGGQLTCDGVDVSGGIGGAGLATSHGADGSHGQPYSDTGGEGGVGQGPATSCDVEGKGRPGDDGVEGTPGAGANGNGTLSAAGFIGDSGDEGASPGRPGQGGGGGGGARKCGSQSGPSAGGGGSGGCGGAPGHGGPPGGASIAIVSLGATLSFSEVTLRTSNGGDGGDGGNGQAGANGGQGGLPGAGSGMSTACRGGKGGRGGPGGRGGGGRGGHSIAVAFTGDPPSLTPASITLGAPGQGGDGEGPTGSGAPGIAQPSLQF